MEKKLGTPDATAEAQPSSGLKFSAPDQLPSVLTVKEAAAVLRLDPRTVRDMIRTGELAVNQHGHAIRVVRDSVIDWASGKRRAVSKKPRRV